MPSLDQQERAVALQFMLHWRQARRESDGGDPVEVFLLYETHDETFPAIADELELDGSQVGLHLYRGRFLVGEWFARIRAAIGLDPLASTSRSTGPSPVVPPRLRDDPFAAPLLTWGLRMLEIAPALESEEARLQHAARGAEVAPEEARLLEEARSPDLSAGRLTELGRLESIPLRNAVAAHPNTPLAVLLDLALDAPVPVAHHPTVRFAARSDPGAFEALGGRALRAIYDVPDLPEVWWTLAASHLDDTLRSHAAESRSCPPLLLDQLAIDESERVRSSVATNARTPPASLARLCLDPDKEARTMAAMNWSTPPEALDALVAGAPDWLASRAASNPNCDAATLERAAISKEANVRWGLARNPLCSPLLLERLAEDAEPSVVHGVASNPRCPLALQERFARDQRASMREQVAQNPSCPLSVLELLARDPAASVRFRVAEHEACSLPLHQQLAADPDESVRTEARHHLPGAPERPLPRWLAQTGLKPLLDRKKQAEADWIAQRLRRSTPS